MLPGPATSMARSSLLALLAAISVAAGAEAGCPALTSQSMHVHCLRAGVDVDCDIAPVPLATVALLECRMGYKPKEGQSRVSNTTCTARGWRPELSTACDIDCGVRGGATAAYISGGEDAEFGELPWHVAVYRTAVDGSFNQACGGTLVSRAFVISAAHCFWSEAQVKLNPPTQYKIMAGKHLIAWNATEPEAQTRDVAEIQVPQRFRGRYSSLQYDIAVVRLDRRVDVSSNVLPICIDWTNRHEASVLSPGVKGTVAGWGVNLNDPTRNVLQKIDVPYVDFDTCFHSLDKDLKIYLVDDKFCAGYANKSRSVCRGDSGGGLVFATENRYYLRGIVGVGFTPAHFKGACYVQHYAGFTLVSRYLPWIKTFDLADGEDCPALPTRSLQARCSLHGAVVDCGKAPVPLGTTALLECRQGYQPKEGKRGASTTNCTTGGWRRKPLACELECGRRGGGDTTRLRRSVGGRAARLNEFPWHVAVFRHGDDDDKYQNICGGSLIAPSFFISAAHCFWDVTERKLHNASLHMASIGKHTREWSTQDEGEQRRSVKDVHVPELFIGSVKGYEGDIALVELSRPADITPAVGVVCISWKSTFEAEQLTPYSLGTIPGWGLTENDTVSPTLRFVDLPYVPRVECDLSMPPDFRSFLVGDKMCAGYVNNSTGICNGDSAAGLVFPAHTAAAGERYYLRGVASTGPTSRRPGRLCPAEHRTLFTMISAYAKWLERIVSAASEDEEGY